MTTNSLLTIDDLTVAIQKLLTSHLLLSNWVTVIERQTGHKFTFSTSLMQQQFARQQHAQQQHIHHFRSSMEVCGSVVSALQLLLSLSSRMMHACTKLYPLAHRLDNTKPSVLAETQHLSQFHGVLMDLQRNVVSSSTKDFSTLWKMTQIHQALTRFLETPVTEVEQRADHDQWGNNFDLHERIQRFFCHWRDRGRQLNQDIAHRAATHLSEVIRYRLNFRHLLMAETQLGGVVLGVGPSLRVLRATDSDPWCQQMRLAVAALEKHMSECRHFIAHRTSDELEVLILLICEDQLDEFILTLKRVRRDSEVIAAKIEQLRNGFDTFINASPPYPPHLFTQEIRNAIHAWEAINRQCRAGLAFATQLTSRRERVTPVVSTEDA